MGKHALRPEPLYSNFGRLVGIDGQAKMSKSLGNAIYLSDDAATVTSKVMSMFTDPNRIRGTEPGQVEGNPVFIYHDAFNPERERVAELKELYRRGGATPEGKPILGDVQVKRELSTVLNQFLEPIRARRVELEQSEDYIWDVLREGTVCARIRAQEVMNAVRSAMKIRYFRPGS